MALLVSVLSVGAARLTAAGAAAEVATAGGVHVAFLVAAALSLVAIVAAFAMRTPAPEPATGRSPLTRTTVSSPHGAATGWRA